MQSSMETEHGADEAGGDEDPSDPGRLSGLRRRLGGLFSLGLFSVRAFLGLLVAAVVALVAGGALAGLVPLPFVGNVGGLVGLFVLTFLAGAALSTRRYLEVALAGAAAAALSFLVGALSSVFLPVGASLLQDYGVAIAGAGAGTGALVAVLGYYFGRDLRAGLTRDI